MQLRQITQISEAHCGAAVLQMLLEVCGVVTSQQAIAYVAGVEETIQEHGMRVDQIATACARLAPQLTFWYKYHSSLEDIRYLLDRNIPLGVEWQGLFYNSLEEEAEDGGDESDFGHYSIISFYDEEQEQLVFVDPYKDFVNRNRIMSVHTFLQRWWDTNEVKNHQTGRMEIVQDTRLLFFVTDSGEWMPEEMGYKKFNMIQGT